MLTLRLRRVLFDPWKAIEPTNKRIKKMKTAKLYEIRYYPSPSAFSKHVGYKGKLVSYQSALKLVKRLKKAGVDAAKFPFTIKQ